MLALLLLVQFLKTHIRMASDGGTIKGFVSLGSGHFFIDKTFM